MCMISKDEVIITITNKVSVTLQKKKKFGGSEEACNCVIYPIHYKMIKDQTVAMNCINLSSIQTRPKIPSIISLCLVDTHVNTFN